MRDHIRVLGILNIVMGCFTALIGVAVLFALGGIAGIVASTARPEEYHDQIVVAPILLILGVAIAIFFLLLALPSIIGGWALMKFKPWARIMMIIVSTLHLLHVPLGTALGVYGFWVLFSEEGRRVLESGNAYGTASNYPIAQVPRNQI